MLRNPLNVEVTISGLTAVVQDAKAQIESPLDFVEVEVIDEVTLGERETRTASSLFTPIKLSSFNILSRSLSQSSAQGQPY